MHTHTHTHTHIHTHTHAYAGTWSFKFGAAYCEMVDWNVLESTKVTMCAASSVPPPLSLSLSLSGVV